MMENPFFNSSYGYYPQSISPYCSSPSSSRSKAKKVVSIPIHFVESEHIRSKSKSEYEFESALKIQKVYRGFRVRKNVKKIMSVRGEVEAVEKKVEEREAMELIRRDSKEKLKLNESLMALLLKLDSVRGVDDGVRDLRKAVIRKAIMLQEKIDSFFESIDDQPFDDSNKIDKSNETRVVLEDNCDNSRNEDQIEASIDEFGANCIESADNTIDNEGELPAENPNSEKIDNETWECLGELKESPQKSDHFQANEAEKVVNRSNDEWLVVGGGKEERKRSKEELLEKMVEDQEIMMAMISDLCERNAAQANLISSLSNRVEQLEKMMSDRELRKKKKKKNATVNGFVNV